MNPDKISCFTVGFDYGLWVFPRRINNVAHWATSSATLKKYGHTVKQAANDYEEITKRSWTYHLSVMLRELSGEEYDLCSFYCKQPYRMGAPLFMLYIWSGNIRCVVSLLSGHIYRWATVFDDMWLPCSHTWHLSSVYSILKANILEKKHNMRFLDLIIERNDLECGES